MRHSVIFYMLSALAITAWARAKIPTVESVDSVENFSPAATPIRAVTNIPEIVLAKKTPWITQEKLREIMAAAETYRIPAETLKAILVVAKTHRISADTLTSILAIVGAYQIQTETLATVLAAAEDSKIDPVVSVKFYAAVSCKSTSSEKLVDAVIAAAQAGVKPEDLRKMMSLARLTNISRSRFDALTPTYFTRMWAVKMKAQEAEKDGGNTDELWKLYWALFEQDVYAEETEED